MAASIVIRDSRKIPHRKLAYDAASEAAFRGAVAEKATALFGYTGAVFAALGPLARTLSLLEIEPLDTEAVKGYMASKEHAWKRINLDLVVWLSWVGTFVAAILGVSAAYHWNSDKIPPEAMIPLVVVGLLGAIVLGCICAEGTFGSIRWRADWKTYRLAKGYESYPRYIPLHVLNKAVEIAEALPQADLRIHELWKEREHFHRPDPDPFLSVTLGLETYYIDVWDEREFEAKM